MTSKIRNSLTIFSFLLLSITIIGIFWLAITPGAQAGLIFAYAAGLSMIFLPCTLPLVFVIIPLAMKQSPLKGLTMAALFGLGLAITLSIYGAAVAWVGGYIGMNSIIRWMFGIAGAIGTDIQEKLGIHQVHNFSKVFGVSTNTIRCPS